MTYILDRAFGKLRPTVYQSENQLANLDFKILVRFPSRPPLQFEIAGPDLCAKPRHDINREFKYMLSEGGWMYTGRAFAEVSR